MANALIEIENIDPAELAWRELNDLGNAERLVARASGKLVYVREWGWMGFDGRRWSNDDGERLANLLAHGVAKGVRDEIAALNELSPADLAKRFGGWCTSEMRDDRVINLHKHMVQSGNANRTAAMLQQAKNLLNIDKELFDREPFSLNVLNGTLRMVAQGDTHVFKLHDHDPSDYLTRCCATRYDPDAACPKWRGHLDKALPNDPMRVFFQEAVGYGFTGSVREQVIFFLQGRGGDGKSTCMDTLRDMADGYGQSADVKTFLEGPERSGADASPDLFRMQGDTRLISMAEPKRGQALAEARVKALTGGGKIAARTLNSGIIVEFVPKGKGFLECNSKPRISGDDDGIWRRVIVINFPYQFKPHEMIKGYVEQLREEWPGILNWVLEGWLRWYARGRLDLPQDVLDAVEDYRRSANPFGEWLNARVDTRDPLALELSTAFYDDYKDWCQRNDVADREVLSSTMFGRMLGDRQIIKKGMNGQGRVLRRGGKLRPQGERQSAPSAAPAANVDHDPVSTDWSQEDDPLG